MGASFIQMWWKILIVRFMAIESCGNNTILRNGGVRLTIGTAHSSILCVYAVVCPPAREPAVSNVALIAKTPHVVHPDVPHALPKPPVGHSLQLPGVTQLSAHHVRIHRGPKIIAYGAPGATVIDLNTPLAEDSASH